MYLFTSFCATFHGVSACIIKNLLPVPNYCDTRAKLTFDRKRINPFFTDFLKNGYSLSPSSPLPPLKATITLQSPRVSHAAPSRPCLGRISDNEWYTSCIAWKGVNIHSFYFPLPSRSFPPVRTLRVRALRHPRVKSHPSALQFPAVVHRSWV